jgi:2-C-methyl-D-erythritol 2,4-cyclodiphosphate synthase
MTNAMKIRSGVGYDLHRIQPGPGLYLGGIMVSNELQAVAHSDGDVLIHALIDSLLGALGEADIGELFPDSDPRFKGIRSELLLRDVKGIVDRHQAEIMSIDCVVIVETPKVSSYKSEIRSKLAAILDMDKTDINVKAKTKEKMDAVGRGEAIECFAISMIRLNR